MEFTSNTECEKHKDMATFLQILLGQNFFISWFTGLFFFRFRVGGGTKKNKQKSSENDQLTGHFQSFFFFFF